MLHDSLPFRNPVLSLADPLPAASNARTRYFGVITEREYIKIKGERVPFWEFLDRLPDGWLTSLAYRHQVVPADRSQMWDCGAWSYKDASEPKLGAHLVTPAWALQRYEAQAAQGSIVIAPDHLLIEVGERELDERRKFNEASARAFLPLARAAGFRPMAAIHGMDGAERLAHARHLLDLGYDALAVGGVAARASQQQHVVNMVRALREETRGAYLHVLGLSAPSYMQVWNDLGVDACDGSSHFKQAFTGGVFYVHDAGQLVRLKAARRDPTSGDPTGPLPDYECACTACTRLRAEGVDTRTYGSNEHNMGRAAHNLNMLMRAHDYVMTETVYLVSCTSQKQEQPTAAADLYLGPWFKKARRYVESQQGQWYILSAEHGLLPPDRVTAPYERSLHDMSSAQRAAWTSSVERALQARFARPTRFVILAGRAYRDDLSARLRQRGNTVEAPLEGLGIGQQLQWFDRAHPRAYVQTELALA